jgi:hypothetical protein
MPQKKRYISISDICAICGTFSGYKSPNPGRITISSTIANLNEKFPLNKSMLPLSSWVMLLHKQIVTSAYVNNIYTTFNK